MIALYIHIPFCKSRCRYCDFFSTTSIDRRKEYVDALLREWELLLACNPIKGNPLPLPDHSVDVPIIQERCFSSIYFGGGTPSLLDTEDLARLIQVFPHTDDAEITLEANPGDLDLSKLTALRQAGVNRLSIGIQSFDDNLLHLIGRRHDAQQAMQAVTLAQQAGFTNISIDLMYGLPTQTMEQWSQTVSTALKLQVQHISCYCLSYEDNTPLAVSLRQGEIQEIDEDTENTMYDYLCDTLKAHGYEHYEVSNFALPSFYSRHNSAYWHDTPYIGLGAGAHAYDGSKRYWNPSDLNQYLQSIRCGRLCYEHETLTAEQHRIEQIMLSLRTSEGVTEKLLTDCQSQIDDYIRRKLLYKKGTNIVATQTGLHILNRIIEDLI